MQSTTSTLYTLVAITQRDQNSAIVSQTWSLTLTEAHWRYPMDGGKKKTFPHRWAWIKEMYRSGCPATQPFIYLLRRGMGRSPMISIMSRSLRMSLVAEWKSIRWLTVETRPQSESNLAKETSKSGKQIRDRKFPSRQIWNLKSKIENSVRCLHSTLSQK